MFKLNLQPKIEEFKNCLKQWEHRKLTLLGKITVIKSFALPKLIYPLSVLLSPNENVVKEIKKCMFDFIWENKPDKISRDTITNDYSKGGLKMIDIDKFIISLKASWVKRLFYSDTENDSLLKCYYEQQLNKFGANLIFESSLSQHIGFKVLENLPLSRY